MEHAPETTETKGLVSMGALYKITAKKPLSTLARYEAVRQTVAALRRNGHAMKPMGLLLSIGVLVASTSYGQESRDANPSLRLA